MKTLKALVRTLVSIMCWMLITTQQQSAEMWPSSFAAQDVSVESAYGNNSIHHIIETKKTIVQELFDQGLTLIYAFNFDEAARSFGHAVELDPGAAMPYWGIALANSPSYSSGVHNPLFRRNAAREAIQKAQQLSSTATANERAYVEALAHRFNDEANPDMEKLARDYVAAMRALSRQYPDDPDAAALYAESLMDLHPYHLWTYDGRPGENTLEIVSILEGVLRRWPNHVGANHFYIHAMEASPHPDLALHSARRLETLVPSAGHLVHMPAHIYFRLGDYSAAVKSALAADEADRNYLRKKTIPNTQYEFAFVEHNLYFLIAAANMDGEFSVAYKAAIELQTRIQAAVQARPEAESLLITPLAVLLRFARWDDILALPPPSEKLNGPDFFRHFARGCAFAAKGNVQEARVESDLMEQIYKSVPAEHHFGMFGPWNLFHSYAALSLNARIAAASADSAAAIAKWRAAVSEQDRLERVDFYRELSPWYCPFRESLGAALLLSGQPLEAEQVFNADLSHDPKNPRSLFGLWKALEIQKKTIAAKEIRQLFDHTWRGTEEMLRLEDF